jgi:hypothetical protein
MAAGRIIGQQTIRDADHHHRGPAERREVRVREDLAMTRRPAARIRGVSAKAKE